MTARAHESAPLLHSHESRGPIPFARRDKVLRDDSWKLYVNTEVQPDL